MDTRKAGAVALIILAYAFRLMAIALCVITCVLCFSGITARLGIVGIVTDLSRTLPQLIAGYGVISSPFGGVFRLDFALTAVALFLLDYLCCRASRALR